MEATKFLQLCIYLSLDLFLPIYVHIPFDVLWKLGLSATKINSFRHYLLISYMLLPPTPCSLPTERVLPQSLI